MRGEQSEVGGRRLGEEEQIFAKIVCRGTNKNLSEGELTVSLPEK